MKTREDFLCEQLDREDLSPVQRAKYEKELDGYADRVTKIQKAKKEAEEKERVRRAEIRARIEANDADFIWTLGSEEFGSDYEILIEGSNHVVYSKVARDDQENRHVCESEDAANQKLRTLYYDRLYNKYVRYGQYDTIGESIA